MAMTDHPSDTEPGPNSKDELDRLEEMQQRLKDNQEAWRNLLRGLGDLKKNGSPQQPTEPRKP